MQVKMYELLKFDKTKLTLKTVFIEINQNILHSSIIRKKYSLIFLSNLPYEKLNHYVSKNHTSVNYFTSLARITGGELIFQFKTS